MARKKVDSGEEVSERDETLIAIGQRVRELRVAAGLTQTELGKAASVSQAYVYLVEVGGQNLTVTVLIRIARAFGASVGSFFPEAQTGAPSDESLGRLANAVEKLAEAVQARRGQEAQTLKELESLEALRLRLLAFLEEDRPKTKKK